MRYLICLTLILLAFPACAQMAGVNIPAKQTFILGEYKNDAYRATMTNKSNRDVAVQLVNKANGSVESTLTLAGREARKVQVSANQQVHLVNNNGRSVKVMVRSNVKGIEGMRYINNDGTTKDDDPINETKSEAITDETADVVTATVTGEGQTVTKVILQPGQRLIFGEGNNGGYGLKLINRGAGLDISGRTKVGRKKTQGFGIGRFGNVDMYLREGEVLYVLNRSGKRSTLTVKTDVPVVGARVL